MNQFKELREKQISKLKRIKDDAMINAIKETRNSFILHQMQRKINQAGEAEKNKLINQMNQRERILRTHLFHSIYNRRYSDKSKQQDKIKLIMDYDFPLK